MQKGSVPFSSSVPFSTSPLVLAIQRLWKDGKRQEAIDRVPDAMVTEFGAIGTAPMVAKRFEAYRDAGINALTLRMDTKVEISRRIANLEQVMDLLPDHD